MVMETLEHDDDNDDERGPWPGEAHAGTLPADGGLRRVNGASPRYRVARATNWPRSRDIKKRILSGEVSKNARESKAQGNQQEDDAQLAHDEEDEEDEDSKH